MTDSAVLQELRALRLEMAELRAALLPRSAAPVLLAAIEDYFGTGRFTVAGLINLAADDPHGAIGAALADLIDLNAGARAQATALGRLLCRMPGVEVVGEVRGAAVYQMRT